MPIYFDIILLLACFGFNQWINRGPLIFQWFFTFPGIVVHEAAHYLIALVTGGRPRGISVIPSKDKAGRWMLGSVAFQPTWYNGAFVALAPLLLWPLAWQVFLGLPEDPFVRAAGLYAVMLLITNGWPSTVDWGVTARYPLPVLLVAASAIGIWLA